MDELVLRGMAKWPDVPAVYGWLALDRRGNWLLKGEKISNPTVVAFIGRNYESDDCGRWFFQNGPQRVYVALEYTPFVYRVREADAKGLAIEAHTGKPATRISGAWVDENGALLVETELGLGLLHDHDLDTALSAMVDASGNALGEDELLHCLETLQHHRSASVFLRASKVLVPVHFIDSREVASRFGFIACPREPAASPANKARER